HDPRDENQQSRHLDRTGAEGIPGRAARGADLCWRLRAADAGKTVNAADRLLTQRVLILAPRGRDAMVAKGILRDARIPSVICLDLPELVQDIRQGADVAIVTEEATRAADVR